MDPMHLFLSQNEFQPAKIIQGFNHFLGVFLGITEKTSTLSTLIILMNILRNLNKHNKIFGEMKAIINQSKQKAHIIIFR